MMDFLRRLAPPNPADASRAIAVMPARFASENPLQSARASSGLASPIDDDDASVSLEPRRAPPPTDDRMAVDRADPHSHPLPVVPRAVSSGPLHQTVARAALQGVPPRGTSEGHAIGTPAAGEWNAPHAVSATTSVPRLNEFAALPAGPTIKAMPATATRPPAVQPLSQAVLAQRAPSSREENHLVHVTIGRIDVVANTAPAPAARTSPAPRQASVSLADYLRKGSRP